MSFESIEPFAIPEYEGAARLIFWNYSAENEIANCQIQVEQDEINATSPVYFHYGIWKQFVKELNECGRTFQGEARLKNLPMPAPEKFSLRIWNTDPGGTFALEYELEKWDYNAMTVPLKLNGSFFIDRLLLFEMAENARRFGDALSCDI